MAGCWGDRELCRGQTNKTLTIDVSGDLEVESNQVFTVRLSNPTGTVLAGLGTESAIGTIQTDDTPPTFGDFDGDGDFDALVGENSGKTNYFENTGSAQKRAFAAPVTGGPFGLEDVGKRNAPVAADIDGDGDIDVLVGEYDGNVNFFENVAPLAEVSIAALDADKAEGDAGNTPFTFTVTRTGDPTDAGTVDFAVTGNTGLDALDFDGGVLPSGTVNFAAEQTNKTLTIDVSGDLEVESNQVFTVRLSNPTGTVLAGLGTESAIGTIQTDDTPLAEAQFTLSTESAPFGLSDVRTYSTPTFVDIDGDGDFDAFVGARRGNLNFSENTGNSTSAAFAAPVTDAPFGLSDVGKASNPTLVDIDGDGDLDAFVGEYDGNVNFFENTGSSTSAAFAAPLTGSPFGLSDVGSRSAPTFVDIDGDGDLDAFVGEGDGNVNFFENTGSSTSAAFAAPLTDSPFGLSNVGSRRGTLVDGEPRATTFGDIDYVGSHSNPTLVDIDGDGDLDAFVGLFVGLFGEVFDPYLNFFENTGSSSSAAFDAPVTNAPFGLSRVGDLIAPNVHRHRRRRGPRCFRGKVRRRSLLLRERRAGSGSVYRGAGCGPGGGRQRRRRVHFHRHPCRRCYGCPRRGLLGARLGRRQGQHRGLRRCVPLGHDDVCVGGDEPDADYRGDR